MRGWGEEIDHQGPAGEWGIAGFYIGVEGDPNGEYRSLYHSNYPGTATARQYRGGEEGGQKGAGCTVTDSVVSRRVYAECAG